MNLEPPKDLTIKQRRWIKEYIETGNATEAAMRVYDCKDRESAGTIGSENLLKLAIPDLMEEMKLTDVALMNVGIEGMAATKSISGVGDANHKSIEFIEVPDYAVRHKYWETMLKLKRRLSDKDTTPNLTQINIDKGNAITFVNFNEQKS